MGLESRIAMFFTNQVKRMNKCAMRLEQSQLVIEILEVEKVGPIFEFFEGRFGCRR